MQLVSPGVYCRGPPAPRFQCSVSSSVVVRRLFRVFCSEAPQQYAAAIAQITKAPQPLSTTAHSEFFAREAVSFEDLGYAPKLASSLLQAGIRRPAQVQVLSADALLSGKTTVLAAETGSGKTLAYLGPIISSLLRSQSTTERRAEAKPGALVLCPNVALCDQVVAMANSMVGADGQPLLSTTRISSSHPPPRQLPDITVATPAGLIYASDNYSLHYGPSWTREGIVARMHHVVFDEADLLLTGGFERDAKRLLQALQDADRARLVASACRDLGLGEPQFRQLPYHIRRAAAEGGAAAMQAAGALHRGQSLVQHQWVPVTSASWAAALQAAVRAGASGRTLVFTSDVAAAEEAAEVLRDAGLSPLVYHRRVPQAEREQALAAISTRDHSVMVCTDAAARGLDIALVSHVVQATFASSAVDFLHRVGRTGRAGNAGRVTSLYLPEQAPLAEAIRGRLEDDEDIEGTFSRNRSFRNKYKRYGRFVPRGEVVLNL
ncbi:hypothetical protein WJX73_010253 [Symbiochloris irregularis]|uniref:P-loop containing nucleoside triphosphate hydrolase protein n=1 Tax=Symbiochloris irregularis TaxID=706552 RepID=A0AAW1PHB0_9CHLO